MNNINSRNFLIDREAINQRREALVNAYVYDVVARMKSYTALNNHDYQLIMPEIVPRDVKERLMAMGYEVQGKVISARRE